MCGRLNHWQVRALALAMLVVCGSVPLAAQSQRIIPNADNPPIADLKREGELRRIESMSATDAAPPSLPPQVGEVTWSATIEELEGKIYNPRTDRDDKVRLRSYKSDVTRPDTPFVGPTIELQPGETLRITLDNKLERDPACGPPPDDINRPHCSNFNSTNLHAHGLWVNPEGNSDNVFVRINPGVAFQYEYNIPADHPSGTFWYHPHLHGSTALQVSSGLAGALIVRGTRLPKAGAPGDIDTLLRNSDGSAFPERIVLFQQIPYACRDGAGAIKKADGLWVCDEGETGKVTNYDQFGLGTWESSGRFTTVNGGVIPIFKGAKAGQVERWRLIHAGVRDAISPSFRKLSETSPLVAMARISGALNDAEVEAVVQQSCGGEIAPQLSIATDGLTRSAIVQQDRGELYPGYREDLLMVFAAHGTYCLIDGELDALSNINSQKKSRKLLAFVEVGEGADLAGRTPAEFVKLRLLDAARVFMPADLRDGVMANLEADLKLNAFAPHASLIDAANTGRQSAGFFTNGQVFQIGTLSDDAALTLKDPQSFPNNTKVLTLGTVDEWRLKSFAGTHPFHIHVNPFQVVAVLDAQGNDVSGYEAGNTTPYARLKGAWKDTIALSQYRDAGGARRSYVVIARTQYRRYPGKFVLHCHILDHEDQGMMQVVEIRLPDGAGGTVPSHH